MDDNINSPIQVPSVTDKSFGYLNPFYKISNGLVIENFTYPSVEHYFQAKKFQYSDEPYLEKVRAAPISNKAHEMGTNRDGGIIRPDWDAVKFDVMFEANMDKFSQNQELRQRLISTGDRKIFQKIKGDTFWSNNDGGRDLLGFILMEIRNRLKDKK
jgi:ribA/ribD-fused uncharacterized protein